MRFGRLVGGLSVGAVCFAGSLSLQAGTNVYLSEVPDYEFFEGCFGTASGNLMGFWDRHGFPDFYTGPTGFGLAPLTSLGSSYGIRSLWATQAGLDGRPPDRPGHVDDYYISYSSTQPDPYVTENRPEHEPDCLGDFIGLSQNRWKNMNGECDGNIDAYSFVYWDNTAERRVNFTPGPEAGLPARDIQSGLRTWTKYRGYSADVFTQLSDLNPEVPPGKGFTFADLRAEIDAGYPVLLFLQDVSAKYRSFPGMDRANPLIHGILAYGYYVADDGTEFVRYRSSFASGDNQLAAWKRQTLWHQIAPLRGVIGYHPHPQITRVSEENGHLTIEWDGPNADLYNVNTGTSIKTHWYVVEMSTSLAENSFAAVSDPMSENTATIPLTYLGNAFFRLRLLEPPAVESE